MKVIILILVNLFLMGFFIYLLRKPGRLSDYQNGRGWRSRLSVAVIIRMDDLTSGFYALARGNGPSVMAMALT